jgi:hypothetical protein
MTFSPNLGRWLQPDPLGLAPDTNLYRYVGDNPANATDPTGLYDDDVHFYMTYYIALSIGLGKIKTRIEALAMGAALGPIAAGTPREASIAEIIAFADNYTDYNRTTQPLTLDNTIKAKYHFRVSPDGKVVAGPMSMEAKQIITDAFAQKTISPWLLGIGLHAYQDSWSHEGFSVAGHGAQGHSPDDPSRDVKKAMAMAEQTYRVLEQYYKRLTDKNPDKTWDKIKAGIEEDFKAGIREQNDTYPNQMKARINRWRARLLAEFKDETQYNTPSPPDPRIPAFLSAAAAVTAPGEGLRLYAATGGAAKFARLAGFLPPPQQK